jgi:hypothetical protein
MTIRDHESPMETTHRNRIWREIGAYIFHFEHLMDPLRFKVTGSGMSMDLFPYHQTRAGVSGTDKRNINRP